MKKSLQNLNWEDAKGNTEGSNRCAQVNHHCHAGPLAHPVLRCSQTLSSIAVSLVRAGDAR